MAKLGPSQSELRCQGRAVVAEHNSWQILATVTSSVHSGKVVDKTCLDEGDKDVGAVNMLNY